MKVQKITANVSTKINKTTSRTGYTFLGWSTDKNATSAQYEDRGYITTDKSLTLYAVWQKNN